MNVDYWLKKWQEKDIRFHQTAYHPQLKKFGEKLPKGTVLVPLCGKTLDMIYLASLDHKVIGVELSDIACREFFNENNITVNESSIPGFKIFESASITLYCGDFFNLPEKVWKEITGVYDRAALVALPEDVRRKYASEIATKSHAEILLISFEYGEGTLQGPPFSVPESEIRSIYRGCSVEKIDSHSESVRDIAVSENAFWIRTP